MEIGALVEEMMTREASDLHLVGGQPPTFRMESALVRSETDAISGEDLQALITTLLDEEQQAQLRRGYDVESHLRHAGRLFQIHVLTADDQLSLSARVVLNHVPDLAALRYTPENAQTLADLIRRPRGLMLVTGETGSGKHTLCAAMLENINRDAGKRIWTLEDPIGYEMQSKQALISQRAIGRDVAGYEVGLQAAMRADVDIIYIDDLRSLEAVQLALTLAETGHTVLAVMGVGSVSEAVQRLVDVFGTQGDTIRRLLAQTLVGVVAQRLLRRPEKGRVPVIEILLNSPRTRQAILDGHSDLTLAIEAGRQGGMQTMDDALLSALQLGQISYETAWDQVVDKNRLPGKQEKQIR